ncbi:putative mannosyl-oligosaccharide alpha--mannosidase [Rosellinia necatrix]|uniref:alpha-1,2-Mannosidase n=1 Tax=Rosellinia necatrix TaxID=77044 RepID=A0A1W2THH7_ROSNE|nr:putative mannosyl-oligosaccharide alpha--mannosidase [Rosellinia necatrix]
MAVRRVRIILAVLVFWVLASWYYKSQRSDDAGLFGSTSGSTRFGGDYRWKRLPTRYHVDTLAELPTNKPARPIPQIQAPKPQEDATSKDERLTRLAAVRESFIHSWTGYKKHAWGHDEIKPISAQFKDPFGGWAATLVDSLDTLWLLGLKAEFESAVTACSDIDFTITKAREINVFETTIRYLGGFLAAYELSDKQYPSLLNKSTEVASLLMTAFDTPNRMPIPRFNWRDYVQGKTQRAPMTVLLAEIGTLSLEFTKMSQLTGDMQYYDAIQRIYDELETAQSNTRLPGMWPVLIDASSSPMRFKGDGFSLGGMSDSAYEYLPKQYLLLGGALEQPRKLYEKFIDVAKKHLLHRAVHPGNLAIRFFGDSHVSKPPNSGAVVVTTPRTQHLTCFVGGMVGMAAKIFDRPADLKVAAELTDGCVWSYSGTPSGVGPEVFFYIPCEADDENDDCQWSETRWHEAIRKHWAAGERGEKMTEQQIANIVEARRLPQAMVDVYDRRYQLRPEAIESVFYMYRMTGDAKWMDKAWDMFTAIEKHTRTSYAAAALDDVTDAKPDQVDSMESFWLAETLKYFYLIFGDWELFDLDKWVLNTEAHPLRRADA